MSAWSWSRPEIVTVVVTAVGANGQNLYCCRDLRPGRSRATTIELPDGTQAVTITRPVRERVELGQHRAGRSVSRPVRPGWRDDSSLVMWWRAMRAERDARRAVRSMRNRYR